MSVVPGLLVRRASLVKGVGVSESGLPSGTVTFLFTDTKIRLPARIAFGFHGFKPLVALASLLEAFPHDRATWLRCATEDVWFSGAEKPSAGLANRTR
jgi:hypothetical protein